MKLIWAAIVTLAAAAAFAVGPPVELASADQCVAQCRARHNQCRIATKGSSSCDGQLQACMDGCRSGR